MESTGLDIELLKTFLEVKNTRHFGRAADNLYLTQAAVSARIRHLEDIMGVSLFTRGRNNIQLTSEGERLVRHAETVLLAWSRARQEVALDNRQLSQITIGGRYGVWNAVMQKQLLLLHESMPGVAIRAENYPAETVIKMLMDRTLDIAISYDPPNLPELKAVQIGTIRLVMVSTLPKSRRTLPQALADNYVYVDWGTLFSRFHAKSFPNAEPAVLRTNISSVAREFIASLRGSAYLPRSEVAEPSRPKLYEVKEAPVFERKLNAVFRSNSDKLELIGDVVNQLDGIEI